MLGSSAVASRRGLPRRLRTQAATLVREHPVATDAATAAVLGVAALVSMHADIQAFRSGDPSFRAPGTVAVVVAMLGITVPLAWRRRFPLTTLLVVVAAFLLARLVLHVDEASVTVLASSLAVYSAAAHGSPGRRSAVIGLALSAALAEVVREVYSAAGVGDPLVRWFFILYNAVFLALPWVLGASIAALRRREHQLAEQAHELRREREDNARRAVFEERVRIARELHDVVAHHVSVMGVQAGAARRVLQRHPEQAQQALSAIETASRQAVQELHRLLGFLRRDGESELLAPQPVLAQLPDLLHGAELGGLAVRYQVEGSTRALPPTLELSAYRVIQEALTNTRKHSDSASATVRLTYGAGALELEVLDDGPTRADQPEDGRGGNGQGLIGMRERAALHGGHVRVGPRPEGGFAVQATFPLVELPAAP
jgi:signal transduction histidine kinase